MDAEDLSKAALTAIDDWLKEEIVGFAGGGLVTMNISIGRASKTACDSFMGLLFR